MNHALVIVDMQYRFLAARGNKIRSESLKQIQEAKDNNHLIIILEYQSFGRTLPSIRKMLEDYDNVYYLDKSDCDGSRELVGLFTGLRKWPKNISFLGVNTNECVQDTVLEFFFYTKRENKNIKVKVIKDCCRHYKSSNSGSFELFEEYGIEVA